MAAPPCGERPRRHRHHAEYVHVSWLGRELVGGGDVCDGTFSCGRRDFISRGISRYGRWAGGATRGSRHGIWRVPRFHARPLLGPRTVHGPRRSLHADRPAVLHDAGGGGDGEFLHGELFARARGIGDPVVQGRLHGAARAPGAVDYGRRVPADGAGAMGDRRDFDAHRDSPRGLHLAGTACGTNAARRPALLSFPESSAFWLCECSSTGAATIS